MTEPTAILEAAKRLGMKPEEIRSVEDSPAGELITTFDGIVLIDVPADAPDADGKSGLMFLAAPTESYGGTFPIYAQPGADDTVDTVDDSATADGDPDEVPDGTIAVVLQWVAGDPERATEALEAEQAKEKPRPTMVTELEAILEQTAAAGDSPGIADDDSATADGDDI